MKNLFNFLLLLSFLFQFNSSVFSQVQFAENKNKSDNSIRAINPLYEMRIQNITAAGTSPMNVNTLFFDIYIYHTNSPESGPFEYAAGQYYINFNPDAANGSNLIYTIMPNSSDFTNPDAVPRNPSVVGNKLVLERNIVLGPGNGPIISTVYPGTRVVKMKLRSNNNPINLEELNLGWRDSTNGDPYTQTFAYIDSMSTNVTGEGSLFIDSANSPLPVELNNFSSYINRNNTVLNWSTSSEINNSGFDIERSVIADQWSKIGFIQGNGTSSGMNTYSFEDKNLSSGRFLYRLKQIDYNGNYIYYDLQNEVVIGIPERFFLSQNYPNPFNPSTNINFDLPYDGIVNIKLYDVSGKEAAVILNEVKSAGYYTVNFSASNLTSGVYYYRIDASGVNNNFIETKKMVLMK